MAGRSRILPILGLTGAVGAGYYLYQAGGDPKVAEKKFESDAARLSSTVKSELPGREKELKTKASELGHEAGAKLDNAWAEAKAKTNSVDAKLDAYRTSAEANLEKYKKETGSQLSAAVDKFDKTVEDAASKAQAEAAKAKGGLSSWFGGK